jgi:hypothetical protein
MNVMHQIIIYLPTFQTNPIKTFIFQTHTTQKKLSLSQQGIRKSTTRKNKNKNLFLLFHPFLVCLFFSPSSLKKQKMTMMMRYKHVVVIYKSTTKGHMNFLKKQAPKNET